MPRSTHFDSSLITVLITGQFVKNNFRGYETIMCVCGCCVWFSKLHDFAFRAFRAFRLLYIFCFVCAMRVNDSLQLRNKEGTDAWSIYSGEFHVHAKQGQGALAAAALRAQSCRWALTGCGRKHQVFVRRKNLRGLVACQHDDWWHDTAGNVERKQTRGEVSARASRRQ